MKKSYLIISVLAVLCLHPCDSSAGVRYHIVDPEAFKGIFVQEEKKEEPWYKKDIDEKKETYNRETWNNFRREQELGREFNPELFKPYQIKTTTAAVQQAEQEKAKRVFDVELAYESGLSIQGLKTIDVTFSQKKFLNDSINDPDRKKQVNEFDMEQTLRVDIQGKVGRKISVDVHFDDTQENKRDISVVYKGDPDEVVQEAAFGDITLSLPHTEFVNYNKQVFGIKADLKYKMMRFMVIGSRTKGITETRVYTGQTRLVKEELADKNYIARKYYKPFDSDIKRDTIRIWKDDQNADNNQTTGAVSQSYEHFGATATLTGFFDELKPGVDYSFDPITNVITFRSTIAETHVVIIDYQKADESFLHERSSNSTDLIILKDSANIEGISRELKNYYRLRQTKIIYDNNRGNFTFQVQELDKTVPERLQPGDLTVPQYPEKVEVDFDSGIFFFKQGVNDFNELRPFPDDVYSLKRNRYIIFVEYQYRVTLYNLRPNLVIGSERIVLDGKKLTRDVDYYLDYDSGFLTFYNEDMITDVSKIEITYEYAPFGGQFGQTLIGSRLEISPIKHFFIGSSVLYNFSAKPAQVPDMRSQPDSTMVWDVDSRIEDISFGEFPFKINLIKGEFAQSIFNPNIFGKAIVESMEGVKQDNTLSLGEDFWLRASNPNLNSSSSARMQFDAVTWFNEDVKTEEIYTSIGAAEKWWEDEDEQQVLGINYDFTKADADEVSMVQVVSKGGLDYAEKLFLEVIYFDDGNSGRITFDWGEINEDLDGDTVQLETEDVNGNGSLDKDEDEGWGFSYPGLPDVPIEADNGRIDREDLDGDGIFDGEDIIAGRFSIDMSDQAQWRYVAIPLDITDTLRWTNIKQVRMTISFRAGTTSNTGTIKIARIGIVSNRFETPVINNPGIDTTMMVSAVNNQDNPGYDSLLDHPVYNELYPDSDEKKKEQALQIEYNDFVSNTDGSTRLGHQASLGFDFSQHKKLKFFVYNNDTNKKTIYIRFGTESNYFEFEINVPSNAPQTWEMYEIILDDITGDSVADRMVYGNTARQGDELAHPSGTIPSLKNVPQIKIGVRGVEGSGSFWVNEFFVDGAEKRVGQAGTFSGDFEVPRWMTFGGTYREIDRNFRTIASVVTNQDRFEENGYLKFSRLSFMPMNFTVSKIKTKTPSALETGDSGLISVLEEGSVVTESYSGNTSLVIRRLPKLSGAVSRSFTDSSKLKRRDINESASGSLHYTNPVQTPILHIFPTSISGTYSRTNYWLKYSSPTISEINSLEYTDKYSGSLTFSPWKNFTVKPSYSLSTVREVKFFNEEQAVANALEAGQSRKLDIPKSLTQNVKGSVNITLLRWLRPVADYTHNINVNYDILASTDVTTKTINRTSNGKVSWTFEPRNFYGLSGFKPTKSMSVSSSYSINDGDTYEKIPRPLYVQNSVWVRKPLRKEYTEYDLFTSTSGVIDINAPRRKSLTIRDTQNFTGRWRPLDWVGWLKGPLRPLKTISTTNTLTKSKEKTDNTGTIKLVNSRTWPNIDASISNVEKMIYTGWFMKNTRVNSKVYKKIVKTVDTSENIENKNSGDVNFKFINFFDAYMKYAKSSSESFDIRTSTETDTDQRVLESSSNESSRSAQFAFTLWSWRCTPSYAESDSLAKNREGELTTDKITKISTIKIRGDFHKPINVHIPFTTIGFLLKNRLIFDTTVSWNTVRSPELNVTKDNTNTGKLATSVDYELSQNLRIKFGLSGTIFRNKEQNEDDFNEYSGSAGLTIQF